MRLLDMGLNYELEEPLFWRLNATISDTKSHQEVFCLIGNYMKFLTQCWG